MPSAFAEDWNADGLREHAQRFASAPGKRDGLYWETKPGETPSPLGPLVAAARAEGYEASKHRYTVWFSAGQLPPAQAFWSLTMYDLPGQFLLANPLNRYLINSPMLPNLKRDAVGGLTIYLQHEPPGQNKESNWLPAPQGAFYLVMRVYWPKPEVLEGKWKQPPVERVK